MTRTIVVGTEVQKAILTSYYLTLLSDPNGYWKRTKATDEWLNVEVEVDPHCMGKFGFTTNKKFDITSKKTFNKRNVDQILEIAKTVDPTINKVKLYKEAVSLSHIINGRLSDIDQKPLKLRVVRNPTINNLIVDEDNDISTKRARVQFSDELETDDTTEAV